MTNKHGYDDIVDSQQGIFGDECSGICGSAMSAFSKARGEPDQEGLIFEVVCENCGPRKIIVEWPELVAVKFGISPHIAYQGQPGILQQPTQWGFDRNSQNWYPDIRCAKCQWQFRLMMSPGEVEGGLRAAVGKGYLPNQSYQQLAALCSGMKQRVMGG